MRLGAQASANLYSLVMTCRANEVGALRVPELSVRASARASTVEQIERLPWNFQAMLDEQKKQQHSVAG